MTQNYFYGELFSLLRTAAYVVFIVMMGGFLETVNTEGTQFETIVNQMIVLNLCIVYNYTLEEQIRER